MDWEVIFVAVVFISVISIMGIAAYFEGSESGIISPIESDINPNIPDQSDFYLPTVTGENISAYKSSCTELDLNKLVNNSGSLEGQKIKFKGELCGIFENNQNSANMQIKIHGLSLYPYILVSYSTKINYSIGDQLEIYGEYNGDGTYETETVPFIKAAYIEKV